MDAMSGSSLLREGDPRWRPINRERDAQDSARSRRLTVTERLDRGSRLSRTAAELRRAAWKAQRGRPAA